MVDEVRRLEQMDEGWRNDVTMEEGWRKDEVRMEDGWTKGIRSVDE